MPTKNKRAICVTIDADLEEWLRELKERQKTKSLSGVVNQILRLYKELISSPAK